MPHIMLTIDEQQEAKIAELINSRESFRIVGATVTDSDGKQVFLKRIEFHFMSQDYYVLAKDIVEVPR